MSYPDQGPGPVGRRPVAVTLTAAILVVMALGGLTHAVAGLVALNGTVERFRSAAGAAVPRSDRIDTAVTLLRTGAVLATVLAVLAAVLLVLLALGLLSGGPGVRRATWALCGVGLFAGCGALGALIAQRAVPLRFAAADRSTAELVDAVVGAYPSWWIPVNAALSTGQVLGYLVVAVLLALPSVSAHVRRRRPDRPSS